MTAICLDRIFAVLKREAIDAAGGRHISREMGP